MSHDKLTRRTALATGAFALFAPVIVRAQSMDDPDTQTDIPMAERPAIVGAPSAHNIGSFRAIEWQDHYDDMSQVTLIADTESRALPVWDLSDLYAGIDAPEVAADLAAAEASCRAFAERWRGTLSGIVAEPNAGRRLAERNERG